MLRGAEAEEPQAIWFELTGDPGKDLLGKHIRFTVDEDEAEQKLFEPGEHEDLQMRQVGPTGVMTAQGWVRALPCPVEEFYRHCKLGERPPTVWKRHLYLEWYGQNGRVVIELAGPLVEECVREPKGEEDEGEWVELPNLAERPDLENDEKPAGPGITVVRREDDTVTTETWSPVKPEEADETDSPVAELQKQLDAESAAIERALHGEDPLPDGDVPYECELIDYCIECAEERPITSLLGDAANLPPDDEFDDTEVEARLKALLGELALRGVALDVCEHFTPRDCYRLLREEMLQDTSIYEELIGTGWVQHISTWEYCPKCEAEFDEK